MIDAAKFIELLETQRIARLRMQFLLDQMQAEMDAIRTLIKPRLL